MPRPQQSKQTVRDGSSTSNPSATTTHPRAGVIHVGSIAEGGRLIHYVRPVFPHWARKRRLQGIVEFRGVVGKDEKMHDLTLVKGPKELAPYAEAAIRQWRYSPLSFNGTQVDFVTSPLVSFTLHQ